MIPKKHDYRVLGMMSGTSLDGLDLVVCRFERKRKGWKYETIASKTVSYPVGLQSELKNVFNQDASTLVALHYSFGRFMGQEAKRFMLDTKAEVDFISSHGHTIFHAPEKGYTLQIGNGAEIAVATDKIVVCDFRSTDVAKGGQGAPLVPVGDKLLFSEFDACLNLGGFANVSYDRSDGVRIAFDICPVNIVLNKLANSLGHPYDSNGDLAQTGQLLPGLLEKLNNLDYYKATFPKSLGLEWVHTNIFPLLIGTHTAKDLLRTFTMHAAQQIAQTLNEGPGKTVLVTGGGAYNGFLLDQVKLLCHKELVIPTNTLIEMKEAVIFAFLGLLRLEGKVNTLASVTGAWNNSVSGAVYLP